MSQQAVLSLGACFAVFVHSLGFSGFSRISILNELSMRLQVFTWHGCTIELDGVSEVAYVADEVNLSSTLIDIRR